MVSAVRGVDLFSEMIDWLESEAGADAMQGLAVQPVSGLSIHDLVYK